MLASIPTNFIMPCLKQRTCWYVHLVTLVQVWWPGKHIIHRLDKKLDNSIIQPMPPLLFRSFSHFDQVPCCHIPTILEALSSSIAALTAKLACTFPSLWKFWHGELENIQGQFCLKPQLPSPCCGSIWTPLAKLPPLHSASCQPWPPFCHLRVITFLRDFSSNCCLLHHL